MKNLLALICLSILFISCSNTYYIVRHAEKASAGTNGGMMSNDPPLSEKGAERAQALREVLKDKKIGYIFSTNTVRTKTTAEPTREFFNLSIQTYSPMPKDSFIQQLKSLKKNVLIVGHSNTIDDVVNKLSGTKHIPGDLNESIYDNLYILRKKGRTMKFENRKYGAPTP